MDVIGNNTENMMLCILAYFRVRNKMTGIIFEKLNN